ncbi:MAG: O-antigen ligase family protein [Burkholderiaceae bacterium]
MKNTTPDITNRNTFSSAHINRTDRWKAWPFLLLMLSSGLPLNYTLEAARPMTVAEVAEFTQQATSDGNMGNSILFVIFLAGLYAISGWMLLRKPKAVGSILQQQWPLALMLIFIAISVSWSYEQTKVLTNIIHNLGIVLITLAASMYYRHDPWLFPKQLGYVLGINMLIHIAAVVVIPAYAIDWQSRWHGLTPHPNTLGAMALTTLWANAAVIICKKYDKIFWNILFSLAAIVAMIGADSVTSMMTSLCVVMLIFFFQQLNKRGAGRNFYVSMFVVGILGISIFILIGNAIDLGGVFKMFGRDTELTGRTSIWESAFKAIQAHPLLGWSFDDHAYLIQQGFQYPSYHNGYLDIAVSGGIVSVTLMFFLLITWAVAFAKPSRIAAQIAPFSASYVIAYLIHNMTESSLIAPRGQLWQIFLVLIFLGTCKKWPFVKTDHRKSAESSLPPLQIDTIGEVPINEHKRKEYFIG